MVAYMSGRKEDKSIHTYKLSGKNSCFVFARFGVQTSVWRGVMRRFIVLLIPCE
jgi:hypothetical protein